MAQTKVKLVSNGVITVDNLHTNHGITTDHIGEGSVLYYTDARVQSYLTSNNYIKTTDVANLETVTSISLSANTLSYVDEAGNTTNLDLSLYLDDTNLARLVSGTLDGGTGVATFTRDDATTFTVDFSAFLSDANDYVTSAAFNTSDGVLTLTRLGGGTVTVDLDNRYLTSFTETDPIYTASSWYTTTNNSSNWDTAYGWGNHASAGYLTSFTESDPIFSASAAAVITSTNITNWNTAYGWGNHASAGYQPASTAITTSNIGSQSVNYATSSGSTSNATEASYLDVEDTRAGQRMPTDVPEYRVSAEFTNQVVGGWHSLINVKGWHDGYASWQLIGGSDTSTHTNLYFRTGVNSSWGNLNKIWHDGNDGSGSGLDADLLDGIQASSFLRSDADDSASGLLSLTRADQALWTTESGTGTTWRGRLGHKNAAGDKAVFLGSYNSRSIIASHNNALNAWADLYINTVDGSGGGNVRLPGTTYIPIFYDSNNTGYYVDPASTSNLNYTNGVEFKFSTSSNNGRFNAVSDWGTRFYTDSGYIQFGPANSSWAHIYTDRPAFYFNTPLVVAGGSTINSGDLRSPIFYDSNNTGYYLDPNGTSNLNVVQAQSIRNDGSVASDDSFGIYWDSSGSAAYAIYRESGAWSHPYPDLRIAFHTGIKLGANAGYDGVRFYSDYDMSTIVASINDGDSNLRGYYDIIAYASDKRLKEKIEPITNAIEKVKKLNGFTYNWNNVGEQYGWEPPKERESGVFAQEVQEVLPEAVRTAPFDQDHDVDGNMYSKSGENFLTVKYEKLVPLLIEAIKEQQQQIEELKQLINK